MGKKGKKGNKKAPKDDIVKSPKPVAEQLKLSPDDEAADPEVAKRDLIVAKVACALCGKNATTRCSRCASASYCSRECQVSHWAAHKAICKQSMKESKMGTKEALLQLGSAKGSLKSASGSIFSVKMREQRAMYDKALAETYKQGTMDYQLVADYNEFLQTLRSSLGQKHAQLIKKQRILHSITSRTSGKAYDDKCNELVRLHTLIQNTESDIALLNENIGAFMSSETFKRCLKDVEQKCVVKEGRAAVLEPEDEACSFDQVLQNEKRATQREREPSGFKTLEEMLAESEQEGNAELEEFVEGRCGDRAVWKGGVVQLGAGSKGTPKGKGKGTA
jgi:hypothetical protein